MNDKSISFENNTSMQYINNTMTIQDESYIQNNDTMHQMDKSIEENQQIDNQIVQNTSELEKSLGSNNNLKKLQSLLQGQLNR